MISVAQIELYKQLHCEGHSLRYIAFHTKTSPNTVKKYLNAAGFHTNTTNIVTKVSNDSFLIGTYVGIWAGDGTQYQDKGYRIKICCHGDDSELICHIQSILFKLFGKTSKVMFENRNKANVRFKSKFIYLFINSYLSFEHNKTCSVRLKTRDLPKEFLQGFFLGLMLTDGYLKHKLVFNTISSQLADDMEYLLCSWSFSPHRYIHKRTHLGWHDLYMISLTKGESERARTLLDEFLTRTGYNSGFNQIKRYKKNEPGAI